MLKSTSSLSERAFARWYPWLAERGEGAGLAEIRARVLAPARGRALELGAGSGINLRHLPAAVDELTLTDPSAPMLVRLRETVTAVAGGGARAAGGAESRGAGVDGGVAARLARRARIVRADAQALPFAGGTFDTVIATYVLCSVDDPRAALAEIARVLAPGGQLLFCEHVRAAEGTVLARAQDRLAEPHRRISAGCRPNRRTDALLASIPELRVERLEHGSQSSLLPLVRPIVTGVAVREG